MKRTFRSKKDRGGENNVMKTFMTPINLKKLRWVITLAYTVGKEMHRECWQ